jgi:hypothetical protein
MAFKIPVRCGETTTTTGTGTVTTNGAPLQMQTFNAGVGTGNTCPYMIVSGDNVNWERGLGTVTVSAGVTTVARTTVVESSNSNSAISLVGTSFIFVALPGDVANTNGLLDLVFGSSNGTYNLVRSGGVWTTAAAGSGAAGSGLFSPVLSALPTASSTGLSTWQTQNGASVADAATGITITGASASNSNWNMRTKASPGTPYTITALLAENYAAPLCVAGIIGMAIGWTDGTKLHVVQYQNGNLLVSDTRTRPPSRPTTFPAGRLTRSFRWPPCGSASRTTAPTCSSTGQQTVPTSSSSTPSRRRQASSAGQGIPTSCSEPTAMARSAWLR